MTKHDWEMIFKERIMDRFRPPPLEEESQAPAMTARSHHADERTLNQILGCFIVGLLIISVYLFWQANAYKHEAVELRPYKASVAKWQKIALDHDRQIQDYKTFINKDLNDLSKQVDKAVGK
jgi:hypothetical protein